MVTTFRYYNISKLVAMCFSTVSIGQVPFVVCLELFSFSRVSQLTYTTESLVDACMLTCWMSSFRLHFGSCALFIVSVLNVHMYIHRYVRIACLETPERYRVDSDFETLETCVRFVIVKFIARESSLHVHMYNMYKFTLALACSPSALHKILVL